MTNAHWPFLHRIIPATESELKSRKTFRNPMVIAIELAEELKRDGISRAELARRHGLSRARVTQWLSLMELPRIEIERFLAMGDYWDRRLVTERKLRKLKPMNDEAETEKVLRKHFKE